MQAMAGAEDRVALVTTDFVEAYRFLFCQAADQWMQTFIWIGPDGSTGVCVDRRCCFGAAWMSNRFQRLARLVLEAGRVEMRRLGEAYPPPAAALEAARLRREAGVDPMGDTHFRVD